MKGNANSTVARVIIVNRYFAPDHSATSQLASDLAQYLAGRGVEVMAITSRQRYEDAAAGLPATENIGGVHVRRVWTTVFGRQGLFGRAFDYLSFYVSASWRLWRETAVRAVVVVMTDPPLISIAAYWVARRRGAPLVIWTQDLFPEVAEQLGVMRSGRMANLMRRWRDRALCGAAQNVVIGERMAEIVSAVTNVAPVVVIPNWALEEIEVADSTVNPLRAAWNLGAAFVVGYSGNMGRAHRLDVLIDAAECLRDKPQIVFLLVGSGAQREALEAEVRKRNLSNVIFKPYQARENLRNSLTVADIHIVSLDSRLEGLIVPSKFVGVIAVGRPILCLGDSAGELGQLTRESGCGIVLAEDSPATLAAAIVALAADRAEVARMGERARTLWQSRFRRSAAHAAWYEIVTKAWRGETV